MLPRGRRLSRASFATFRPKKRVESPHFRVSWSPSVKEEYAVVVPKKVAAHAVDRNKLRRRVFSLLRDQPMRRLTLVVFAKSGSHKLSFAATKAELQPIFDTLRTTS